MGTKFEYASDWLVNSAISIHNSSNRRTKSLSFNCVNDWGKPRKKELIAERRMEKTGAHRLQREDQAGDQMDKSEDTQNMESIRKTMQMHEDVFKQQANERKPMWLVSAICSKIAALNSKSRILAFPIFRETASICFLIIKFTWRFSSFRFPSIKSIVKPVNYFATQKALNVCISKHESGYVQSTPIWILMVFCTVKC